ncbi:hypothetical protein BGZ80_007459, partial [Entomortierella chlamydospora]
SPIEPRFIKRRDPSSLTLNCLGLCPSGPFHIAHKKWPKHGQRWSEVPAITSWPRLLGRIPSVHARIAWSEIQESHRQASLHPGSIPSFQAKTEGWSRFSRPLVGPAPLGSAPSIQSRMEGWSENSGHRPALLPSEAPLSSKQGRKGGMKALQATNRPRSLGSTSSVDART